MVDFDSDEKLILLRRTRDLIKRMDIDKINNHILEITSEKTRDEYVNIFDQFIKENT